jgi:hypothetical protein
VGLRLLILSWWTPEFIIRKELQEKVGKIMIRFELMGMHHNQITPIIGSLVQLARLDARQMHPLLNPFPKNHMFQRVGTGNDDIRVSHHLFRGSYRKNFASCRRNTPESWSACGSWA